MERERKMRVKLSSLWRRTPFNFLQRDNDLLGKIKKIHCPHYQQQKIRFTPHWNPFIIIIIGQELTRPQIIIYWQITGSRVHDRVYICSLRHPPSLFFYTKEPSCVFVYWVLLWYSYMCTLNKHSIMITNTSDDLSLDDKTVVSYKKSKTLITHMQDWL